MGIDSRIVVIFGRILMREGTQRVSRGAGNVFCRDLGSIHKGVYIFTHIYKLIWVIVCLTPYWLPDLYKLLNPSTPNLFLYRMGIIPLIQGWYLDYKTFKKWQLLLLPVFFICIIRGTWWKDLWKSIVKRKNLQSWEKIRHKFSKSGQVWCHIV